MTENPSPDLPANPSTLPDPGRPARPAAPEHSPGSGPGYSPGYSQPGYRQPVEQAPPGYPAPQQPYQQQYPQPGYGQPYVEQKSKVAAGVLGILLGGFGIHNFYLGFTKKALIQLLVSVLSVGLLAWAMAIWGLVEGILILVGSDGFRADARGIPLKD